MVNIRIIAHALFGVTKGHTPALTHVPAARHCACAAGGRRAPNDVKQHEPSYQSVDSSCSSAEPGNEDCNTIRPPRLADRLDHRQRDNNNTIKPALEPAIPLNLKVFLYLRGY